MSFEIGPIRPPSEARSLLVRVTRNCPWNRCAFCPVYKGARFSIRAVDEVTQDIDEMGRVAGVLTDLSRELGHGGRVNLAVLRAAAPLANIAPGAVQVAHFLAAGGERAFLQDANSLVMRAEQLVQVLEHLHAVFPSLTRVTSYVRAHTLTRRTPEQLEQLRRAGLTRLHVGLESGSDTVLELVRKGADAARHIEAGQRAVAAGFELSEYVMPGLGGRQHWREHAEQSARVLNAINPHFIRLRTTAYPPGTPLAQRVAEGKLDPMDDVEVARELRLFIERLEGTALVQSDHVLNLLPELEGQLPGDRPHMLELLDRFLGLPAEQRRAFVLARRAGALTYLAEMERPELRERALGLLEQLDAREGDLREIVARLMTRFI